MSAYRKSDRCAWCCARLTPRNAAVVGDELVCRGCADFDRTWWQPGARQRLEEFVQQRNQQQQRTAMKATARGIE